jgi:hypothetical protein
MGVGGRLVKIVGIGLEKALNLGVCGIYKTVLQGRPRMYSKWNELEQSKCEIKYEKIMMTPGIEPTYSVLMGHILTTILNVTEVIPIQDVHVM